VSKTIKCEFCKQDFEWLNDCDSIFGDEYELCNACLKKASLGVYPVAIAMPGHSKQDHWRDKK
jgi:hypothetical protein